MTRLLLTAIFLSACGTGSGFEFDSGTDFEYPDGQYGYKASVRELNGVFVLDSGNVLPEIIVDQVNISKLINESEHEIMPLIWSTTPCDMCDELYNHFIRGVVIMTPGSECVHTISRHNRQLDFFIDYTGIPTSDFGRDKWPEVMRNYPTLMFIDTDTMEIIIEVSGHDWGDFTGDIYKKYTFWQNVQSAD